MTLSSDTFGGGAECFGGLTLFFFCVSLYQIIFFFHGKNPYKK